jgi:hypothetical protein
MISLSQPSKRRSKVQQKIAFADLPEKKNLTQSAFSIDRKAYQNPIRKETTIVQTSQAAVISAATPFSIPIRFSSFNLNANTDALKFTPRSGSLPRIVGEEPGDYGDREAVRFHQKKSIEEEPNGEEPDGEEGKLMEEGETLKLKEKRVSKELFTKELPSDSIKGMTQGAESSARLADMAYKGSSERDLSFFEERGYTLDDDFSTDEHIVIVNPEANEVAIGIRGTAFNLNNMLTDATIALGNFEQSERARRTIELRDRLRQRYPNFAFHYAGHSMGGTAAAYAAQDDPNANATTFNAGSTPFGGATETAENVTNYRTEGDAISQGIGNAITIPKSCPSSLAHSSSQFVPGSVCEKPGFGSFLKNTLEAAANVAAKGIKTFSPLIPPEIGVPLKAVSKVNAKLLGEAERQNRSTEKIKLTERRKKILEAGTYRKLKAGSSKLSMKEEPLKEEPLKEEPLKEEPLKTKPFGKQRKGYYQPKPYDSERQRNRERILRQQPEFRAEVERPILQRPPRLERGISVGPNQQARMEAIQRYGQDIVQGSRRTRSGLILGQSPSSQSPPLSQQTPTTSTAEEYTIDFWKNKDQPKKPKKKRNESEEEFNNRKSDYLQFIQLWKEANPPRRSSRKRN